MGNGKAVTENESAAPKVQEQERDFPSVVNTESNSKKKAAKILGMQVYKRAYHFEGNTG